MSVVEIENLNVFSEERVFSGPRRRRAEGGAEPRRAAEQGYVYFVQQDNTKFIKVGRTKDPKRRRTNLQTGNPRELKMYYRHVSDMLAAEHALLEKMKHLNNQYIRGGTEWFHVPDVDRAKWVFMGVVQRFNC